jgi:hypothetical protein
MKLLDNPIASLSSLQFLALYAKVCIVVIAALTREATIALALEEP